MMITLEQGEIKKAVADYVRRQIVKDASVEITAVSFIDDSGDRLDRLTAEIESKILEGTK